MATEYQDNDALTAIVKEALASGEFEDANSDRVKAVFAKGSAPSRSKEAAKCVKSAKLQRQFGDFDFFLVFWSNNWNAIPNLERWETVLHECHHMTRNKDDEPTYRRHEGDFCELPEHDTWSKAAAKRIPMPAIMKTLTQQVTFD
jgi:hypothetical protein